MFCCALLYVHSSFAIILIGKRELVALPSLSSWCLVIVVCLSLTVPCVCLQFVIEVFPDHTQLLFFYYHVRLIPFCSATQMIQNSNLLFLVNVFCQTKFSTDFNIVPSFE